MNRDSVIAILKKMGSTDFKDSSGWLMTNCPLAPWRHEKGTDHHPSMGIKIQAGMSSVNCLTGACSYSGGLLSLVREYGRNMIADGKMTKEELDELTEMVLLGEEEEFEDLQVKREPLPIREDWVEDLGKYHEYMAGRGITEKTAKKWNLGFSKRTRRVLFPVYSHKQELVAITGRSIMPNPETRYKNNPANVQKQLYLFGWWLRPKEADKIVVVEGPIDAIISNQVMEEEGLKEYFATCPLGSSLSEEQADMIVDVAEEVIFMTDNDASGRKFRDKAKKLLEKRVAVSEVLWEEWMEDPAKNREWIPKLLETKKYCLEIELQKKLGGVLSGE